MPPFEPKSFCMSTTITAVFEGSMLIGSGFASMRITLLLFSDMGLILRLPAGFQQEYTPQSSCLLSLLLCASVIRWVERDLATTFSLSKNLGPERVKGRFCRTGLCCETFQRTSTRAMRHCLSTTGRCCCMGECRRENGTGAEYVCSVAPQWSVLLTPSVIVS